MASILPIEYVGTTIASQSYGVVGNMVIINWFILFRRMLEVLTNLSSIPRPIVVQKNKRKDDLNFGLRSIKLWNQWVSFA